jgi:bacillithiol biosynthesis deacetylase BshB2
MNNKQRQILCLLAHPDDETFIFGGSIAHYAKKGVRVTIVSATKGEMGRRMGNPPFITREMMPIVREQELRDACSILGADEPVFLGIRDKTVEFADFDSLVNRQRDIIQELKPDIVLTFHPVWGGHPDHIAIGKAAVKAVEVEGQTALYFISFGDSMKQPERFGLKPSDIVRIDVSNSLLEKLHAFRAHRTQTEMDEGLWQPDKAAVNKFGRYEYFIIGDNIPRSRWDDLFF